MIAEVAMKVRVACVVALASIMCVLSGASLRAQSPPVRYIYDALGRLVSVIDRNDESAVYVYDAVGNLLAIERHTAGTVAILQFSPQSGPIGTTVTISGTGFSATANQNTLTFNGVTATITSATTTQLVASVPTGATSGTIAVTSPLGSATSSSAFTVTSNNNAPTITSFTPTIGVPGTAVTITGTNFQTPATNDRTMFNLRHAAVSSSTSTSIATAVPSLTGSGRISVYTPFGGAVGDDFFVPPSPYTAANVAVTTRWPVNQSSSLSIATAGKIGLAVFDGAAGHRLSLLGVNGSFNNTLGCDLFVSVLKPDGTVLSPADCMESTGFLDAVTTQIAGTYTIFVAPGATSSGSVTLTPYDFVDVSGSITPGGSAVTTTTSVPGQNAKLGFSGTTGQRVSLLGANGMTAQILGCDVFTSILKPDGNAIGAGTCMEGSGFMEPVSLPSNGAYTLLMDPASTATGALTLTLYDVPADISGSITAGGSAVTVTTTVPGQNGVLLFSGSANQRVFLAGTNGISGQIGITCDVTTTIRKPDGSTLMSACMEGSGLIDTQTLPSTGTYTILVDPASYATGSLTLTLTTVPADVTGTIPADGTLVNATTTAPGQNAIYTFGGTSGQRVSLAIGAGPWSTVSLRNPSGATIASTLIGPFWTGFIDTRTLSDTGTYTVFVDVWNADTGTVPLRLYTVPADTTSSVSVNGSASTVSLSTPGQNGSVTFTGTANQQITVRLTHNSMPSVLVLLLNPDGSVLTGTWGWGASFNLAQVTLPAAGTYRVSIDPGDAATGSMDVAVTSP
jgi:YD repeat-containing protein